MHQVTDNSTQVMHFVQQDPCSLETLMLLVVPLLRLGHYSLGPLGF